MFALLRCLMPLKEINGYFETEKLLGYKDNHMQTKCLLISRNFIIADELSTSHK